MWSKSGSLSFLPIVGIGFQPDHFVALANMDLNAPHSGYSLNSKQVTEDLEIQSKRQGGMYRIIFHHVILGNVFWDNCSPVLCYKSKCCSIGLISNHKKNPESKHSVMI